jgi:hypothetical protein
MFDNDLLCDTPRTPHAAPDIRLVNARRLTWDKDAWQAPGFVAFVARELEKILADESEPVASRAEARVLLKKLYAIKRPFP